MSGRTMRGKGGGRLPPSDSRDRAGAALESGIASGRAGDRRNAGQAFQDVIDIGERRRRERFAAAARRLLARRRWLLVLLGVHAAVVVAAAGGIWWFLQERTPGSNMPVEKSLPSDDERGLAFAEWLAFNQVDQLYRTRGLDPDRPLTFPPPGPQEPLSPADQLASLFGRPRVPAGGPGTRGRSAAAWQADRYDLDRFMPYPAVPPVGKPDCAEGDCRERPARVSCPGVALGCEPGEEPKQPGPMRGSLHAVTAPLFGPLMATERCPEMESLLDRLSGIWQWRRSEAGIKGSAELWIAGCFHARKDDPARVREYARRAYCTSEHVGLSALTLMADVEMELGNRQGARTVAACAERWVERYGELMGDTVTVARRYAELASQLWIWFSDEPGSIDRFLDTSREAERLVRSLRDLDVEEESNRQRLLVRIYQDRLEALLVAGVQASEFDTALATLRSSPVLDDSYIVIVDSLEVMFAMRFGDAQRAARAMEMVVQRYRGLPQFVTDWSWDGFLRWLEQGGLSHGEPELAEHFRTLAEVLADDKTPEKMRRLEKTLEWVRKRARASGEGR